MNPSWDSIPLSALSGQIWSTLTLACEPGSHPWRTPVLATAGSRGPSARTVVLRGVTRPGFELIAYSDARAAKIGELSRAPQAAWLFYDPVQRVQVRAESEVRLHFRDPVAQTYWHRIPEEQRSLYRSEVAPGTPIVDPAGDLASTSGDERQFAVLIATVYALDWLLLGPRNHRRAIFRKDGMEWTGTWVEP